MSMPKPVRLRVVFSDAGVLKKSHRRRGLQRCLLQLRPDVATIADLAAQLQQNFGLHRSCPNGLIISMDNFVLPPFETTSILKDNDMIMINKNGVVFKGTVKFCGNQYQEQTLQSRDLAHSNQKLAIMDEIIDPTVASGGDEGDMVLCNGSAVPVETPQSEKMNARRKRKRSTELQTSAITLAIKDSLGDSIGDEEDISLHGNIKHKGATSNEMVNANCKKKHTKKFQASDSTLENKDSQADSQADQGNLTLPIRHKKTSSGEMIQGKQNKKPFGKLQGSDGTSTIEDSQGNSRGDEHDDDVLGMIAHKEEAISNEMMNLKHKRKHLNELQASNMLTSKNSHGDEENLVLPNEKSEEKSQQCEMSNTKLKKKHSHRHQGSKSEAPTKTPSEIAIVFKKIHSEKQRASDTLTSTNSQSDSQGDEEDTGLSNEKKSQEESPQCETENTKRRKKHSHRHQGSKSEAPTETPSEITNVLKRIHSNEQKTSDGTLTIEDSQGKLHRDEHDDGLFGIIAPKEATSDEMLNSKQKRKHHHKLEASNMLTSMNSQVDSQGDEVNLGLPIEKNLQEENPLCEMENTKRKKKHRDKDSKHEAPTKTSSEMTNVFMRIHSNEQESDGNLTVEDSQENSRRDEHDEGLLGMMNSKHKRKRLNKVQDTNTLTSKNSQGDSQGDDEDLVLPNEKKSQEENPQCEIANTKRKKKRSHGHQGSNGTMTVEDSQENSQRDEHDESLLGIIAHKIATSNEMTTSKHKRKPLSKLQDSNTLTSKNSRGDSRGDDEDLGLSNEKKSQEESRQCVMANSNNTFAIASSQGDVVDEDVNFPNRSEASTETPSKMTNMFKRIHDNKQEASDNEVRGIHDWHPSMYDFNADEWKMKSRSSRRKKFKKLFCRTQGLKKKRNGDKKVDHAFQNLSMPITHNLIEIQNPESDNKEEPSDYANADQNTDVNIDMVPVIVRPGHIRFVSSDEQCVGEDDPVNTFQWNGITNKKKGQKWGMEKSYNNWNDIFNQLSSGESGAKGAEVIEVPHEKAAVDEVESHKDSIAEQLEPIIECVENSISEELEARKQLINYESFLPLNRLPEDGDLLVYRVVELSSSWCPELSPFRVGRVSLYDPCSSKIILLPLPEYPRISEETTDEGQVTASLYEEDGTLEIDFSSLVDVRLFKSPESEETTANFPVEEPTPNLLIEETTPNIPAEETAPNIPAEETTPNIPAEETTANIPTEETAPSFPIEETQNDAPVNNQESEACSDHTANEQHVGDGWEAIKLALDEKKAQLEKQKKLGKERHSSGSTEAGPWSYKALRRNAVGPTLAMLRSSGGD